MESTTSSHASRRLPRVPARLHGLLDYAAAIALILAPAFLGLGPGPRVVSVTAGGVLTAYSLLSDYGLGLIRLVPIRVHLALDLAAGVLLLVAAAAFGDPAARIYFAVMGLGVFAAVAVTDSKEPHAIACECRIEKTSRA